MSDRQTKRPKQARPAPARQTVGLARQTVVGLARPDDPGECSEAAEHAILVRKSRTAFFLPILRSPTASILEFLALPCSDSRIRQMHGQKLFSGLTAAIASEQQRKHSQATANRRR